MAAHVNVFAGADGLLPPEFLDNPADFVQKHVAVRCGDAIARRVFTHAWRNYGTRISAKAFGTRGAGARPLECYSAYARIHVSDIHYFATISGDANVVFEPSVKGDQHWPCWKCDFIPLPAGMCLHGWIGAQAPRATFGYAIARAPRKHGLVAFISVRCQDVSRLSLADTLHLTAACADVRLAFVDDQGCDNLKTCGFAAGDYSGTAHDSGEDALTIVAARADSCVGDGQIDSAINDATQNCCVDPSGNCAASSNGLDGVSSSTLQDQFNSCLFRDADDTLVDVRPDAVGCSWCRGGAAGPSPVATIAPGHDFNDATFSTSDAASGLPSWQEPRELFHARALDLHTWEERPLDLGET